MIVLQQVKENHCLISGIEHALTWMVYYGEGGGLACVVLVAAVGEPTKGVEAGSHSLHPPFSEKIAYFVQWQVLELLPRPVPTDPAPLARPGARATPAASPARGPAVRAVMAGQQSEPVLAVTMSAGLDRTVVRGKQADVRSKTSTVKDTQTGLDTVGRRRSASMAAAPPTAGGAAVFPISNPSILHRHARVMACPPQDLPSSNE
jgi:hypothetical protein